MAKASLAFLFGLHQCGDLLIGRCGVVHDCEGFQVPRVGSVSRRAVLIEVGDSLGDRATRRCLSGRVCRGKPVRDHLKAGDSIDVFLDGFPDP